MSNMPDNTPTRLNPDAPAFSPTRASDPRPDNQASTMLVQSQASSIPAYTLQQDQNQLQLQHPASKTCPETLSKFELNGTTYYASRPPILAYSQLPTYYAHNNMGAFYGSYQDGFSNHSNNGYPNNGLGTSLWAGNVHNSLSSGTGHGANYPHPHNYTQPSPYNYTPSTALPAYSNFYVNDENNRSSFQPFAGQLQQVQRIKSGQDDPSLAHNGEGKKKKNKRNNKKKYAKYREDKAQAAAQQNPFAAVKQKKDGNDRVDGNGYAENEESCDDGQATEKASTNGSVNSDNYAQGDRDVEVQKNRRVNGRAGNNNHIDPDTDSDATVCGNVATLKNRRVDNEAHNNEDAHSNGYDYTNGNGNGNGNGGDL